MICCMKGSKASAKMVTTAPKHTRERPLCCPTTLKQPRGPRLASSKHWRPRSGLLPFWNQIHFNCPIAAPTPKSKEHLDAVARTEIIVLSVSPWGMRGDARWSYARRRQRMAMKQRALKTVERISQNHVSRFSQPQLRFFRGFISGGGSSPRVSNSTSFSLFGVVMTLSHGQKRVKCYTGLKFNS